MQGDDVKDEPEQEASGILELGNVWSFVQLLIFCPHWPMNQLSKNLNIP